MGASKGICRNGGYYKRTPMVTIEYRSGARGARRRLLDAGDRRPPVERRPEARRRAGEAAFRLPGRPRRCAALLLLAAGSAGSTDRARSVLAAGRGMAIEQLAPAETGPAAGTGQPFGGVAAVGALFTESNGKLGAHFCTASVVDSTAGDLAVTAAHCVYGKSAAMVFVPDYANGKTPYGIWPVTKVYTDSAWDASQDPDHDVAFLRLSDASDGTPIENLTGARNARHRRPGGPGGRGHRLPRPGGRAGLVLGPGQGLQRHPVRVRLRRVPERHQRRALPDRGRRGDRPGHRHRRDRRLPAGRRYPAGVVRGGLRLRGRAAVRDRGGGRLTGRVLPCDRRPVCPDRGRPARIG